MRTLERYRSPREAVAAIIIVALFLSVTVTLALRLNIWQDEAYSLHTTSQGFASALQQGVFYEAQAPLYFVILEPWRTLNGSAFFARLLSIAFSLITIGISWRFAKRYIGTIPPSFIAAAVALNPFTIWAAVEARPYALAIALSTALVYYFFRIWIDDTKQFRTLAVFVSIAIISAYTQYYIVLLLPAGFAVLLALRDVKRLKSYLAAIIVVALALVPLVYVVPLQLKAYSVGPFMPSRFAPFAIVLPLLDFVFPHEWIGSWAHKPLLNVGYIALVAFPTFLIFRRTKEVSAVARTLGALVAVLCILFSIVIAAGVHVTWPRQTAVLFFPTMLFAFAIIGSIGVDRRSRALRAFLTVYAILTSLTLFSQYRDFSKSGDWRRVGSFLSSHIAPADSVAIFDAEAELPLHYYFHSKSITPIPRPMAFDHFNEADFVIRDEAEIASSLGRAAQGRARVWLVLSDVCDTAPDFYGCGVLNSYLRSHFRTVTITNFNRSSVLQLQPLRQHTTTRH